MSDADHFDDAWLALREGADDRARDPELERELRRALDDRAGTPDGAPVRKTNVLDLGSGTGANLRRLVPRLGRGQRWTLIDHDPALLGRLEHRLVPWAAANGADVTADGDDLVIRADAFDARVRRRQADLARELDALPFASSDLVTGSALLDLAGADWLDSLARHVATNGCATLFVLSYDGRLHWTPALDDDDAVHARFDRHQRTDKGLGRALGPDAAIRFADALRAHGLEVRTAPSDWTLDAAEGELQRELATGEAGAAGEIDPAFASRADRWLEARCARIDAGDSSSVVGHVDVLGRPPGPRP